MNAQVCGNLVVYAGTDAVPMASLLNFPAVQAKANNSIVRMGSDGTLGIKNRSGGTVDFLIDVNGYFE